MFPVLLPLPSSWEEAQRWDMVVVGQVRRGADCCRRCSNGVCLAPGLNLAWRCPEPCVLGRGAGQKAVKTEPDGPGRDSCRSARVGGELWHGVG